MYLIICILIGSVVIESRGIILLQDKNTDLKSRIEKKKEGNVLLRTELVLLKDNRRYLSILARRNLGMIKHGEKVYKFNY
jgi:cell division protein FtsB